MMMLPCTGEMGSLRCRQVSAGLKVLDPHRFEIGFLGWKRNHLVRCTLLRPTKVESPGLVVMGGNSHSEGRRFESLCRILD